MNHPLPPWLTAPLVRLLAQPVPPALLIGGAAGIGKSALAEAFGQALLCEAPGQSAGARQPACGQCAACRWFAEGSHPDFRRISPNTDTESAEADPDAPAPTARARKTGASRLIRLEQIHAVLEFASIGGHRGSRRIILIDPADAMNREGSNALLKTLEEPSSGLLFILVSSSAQRLLPTVRSRCRQLTLPAVPQPQALAWLAAQLQIAPAQAADLLAAEGGAPLSAANVASQDSGDRASVGAVHRLLVDVLGQLPDTSLAGSIDTIAECEPRLLVRFTQQWLFDLACVKAGAQPRYFPARLDRLRTLAGRTSLAALARASQALVHQRALVDHPLNPRLFAEETMRHYVEVY